MRAGRTKSKPRQSTKPTGDVYRQAELRKKYIIYGIGAGAILGGGYLLFNYLQDRKLMNQRNGLTVNNIVPTIPAITTPQPPRFPRGGFPLRKGAKGSLVRQLQQALLHKGGTIASHIRSSSIRPDGTPDGVFGKGTERALRAGGFPTTVTETTFHQITQGTNTAPSASGATGKTIADELISAANRSNLLGTLHALKKMNNTADYLSVKSHLANRRVKNVRVSSPVTALLSVAFKSNESAKVKIRAEFRRMGLKQNSRGIWTLSGLGQFDDSDEMILYGSTTHLPDVAITSQPTLLRNRNGDYILPALEPETVIGYLTNNRKGVAQILTENGVTVYAPSQNLKLI